ncbi:MAG: 2'-5' RNA ligase family protein [candidate division Zixibacteria bacterium]|jgi:2'-5' RNA ligase|nr:2'-5' RNA ligase family protein [candidate division Zixibacteria bacterium]
MSLLAISYPELEPKDFDWIQSIRAEHDELQFELVKPHITLVFATEETGQSELIDHVREVCEEALALRFVMRRAIVMKDHFGDYWYVLMVAAEGYSEIVKLHDQLYTGVLSCELRSDIPFIPHVTIGNSKDPQACATLADRLNAENLAIIGRISSIDIVTYENNRIETICQVELVAKRNVDTR